MEDKNILIIEYQNDFADNLSAIAYSKILENKYNKKSYFKNITQKREIFESYITNINYRSQYISNNRANEIAKKAYLLSKLPNPNFDLLLKNNNNILNIKHFKIDDIKYINEDTKEILNFDKINFIKNYDILEKIQNTNSIGIYIDKKEILNQNFKNFIYNSTKRLNKYIKQTKLFIFTSKELEEEINSYIDFEIITLQDWRENFHFHTQTKYKIIPNLKYSYSQNFWTAVLDKKQCRLNIFDKTLLVKNPPKNWIKN